MKALLKMDRSVAWSELGEAIDDEASTFDEFTTRLTSPAIIAFSLSFYPHMHDCGASPYAIGVKIIQKQDPNKQSQYCTMRC